MFAAFSPMSLEAQKLISVSIGKINASRVTRTGTSLHKSLLVASVLHRARNVYIEEERERATRFPMCPTSPELTVTPVCSNINSNNNESVNSDSDQCDKENVRLECHEDQVATPDKVGEESRLPLGEANISNNVTYTTTTTTTTTTVTPLSNTSTSTTISTSGARKRRRVSDQETAAAISSILPKRLRSELKEDSIKNDSSSACETSDLNLKTSESSDDCLNIESNLILNNELSSISDSSSEPIPKLSSSETLDKEVYLDTKVDSPKENEDESDSSDGEDSASDTSTSSCDEMEVDQLTSLVSYFSFSKSQKQSDYCLVPIHTQSSSHQLVLTA